MSEKPLLPKIRFKGFTNDWNKHALGKEGTTFTGLSGKTKSDFGHGDGRFVTYMNVFKNPISNPLVIEPIEIDDSQKEIKYGDVFFTTSSETPEEVGMSSVWMSECNNTYLNSFCFGYRLNDVDKFDLKFLAYNFRADNFRKNMILLAQGISRYNISKTKVMEIEIAAPSDKKEQSLIGDYLFNLDSLIALNESKVDKLIILKNSLLQLMFTNGKANLPKIRFKGFNAVWDYRKIGNVASIVAGGTPSTVVKSYWEPKEIPWLSSGEVHKKRIDFTDNMISKSGLDNSSARWIPEKSVLIALAGQGKTRGTVAINNIRLTTNQSIAGITFNSDFDTNFVFSNLESRYEELRSISSADGSRGGLNKQLISDIQIPYVQKEEQIKIGLLFEYLDKLINLYSKKITLLKNLKASSLEKMFA